MLDQLGLIKGIHPGLILERELRKRGLGKGRFAMSVDEFPQTLVTITKGKRKMNTALALKIENALGLEEGFLMTLQVYHDIEKQKKKVSKNGPDPTKFRPALFWESDMDKIDWVRQKKFVIRRVNIYGSHIEKNEIRRFYGDAEVDRLTNEKNG